MNELLQNKNNTISSIEISELTGKRHDNIVRDIKLMCNELKIDALKFEEIYLDARNRPQKCYNLPKRESLILGSGYDVVLRAKIIDRWMELELKQPSSEELLSNPDLIIQLATNLKKEREGKERLQLEIDTKHTPRSQFVDQVFKSDDLMDMGQAAKVLGLDFGRNTLFKKLREGGVLFKSSNEPKQQFMDCGYFKVKEKMFQTDEGPQIKLQTFVTQKGLGYLAKIFQVVQLPVNNSNKPTFIS